VLYVPVPLLVGYFVTQRWLFRAGAIQGYRGLTGNKERRAAIEELIHWRWLNRMRESYRAAQDKKLQKGESTLEQHRQAIAAFEQTAAGPEPASHALAAARDRALSAGPGDSAWSNAITAVKYGAPLALAPVFFSVYRFASDAWNSPYVIPEFVLTVALQLCYWLFMAWFFGYYYRHFPGSTGLGKGAYFATAVAVPYLCLQLLLMQPIAQMGSFVIWAGEVFAYTTLLGLFAFDCEVLRQCGLSWQQLTAIHRVPTLSAFGSSLIAALGPLVLAVAHGRARDIANFALSFLGNLYPNGSAGGGQ
jgi:hypothetical protein